MRKDLANLWHLLTPAERKKGAGVVAAMILAAFLQAASAGSLFPFLDLLANPERLSSGITGWLYSTLGFTSEGSFLTAMGVGVLALLIIANAATSLSHWLQLRFKWGINHSLSVRLTESYLGRDYEYFLSKNTAELDKNILSEATQVSNGLLGPVLSMFRNGALAVAMLGAMMIVNPFATLVVGGIVGGGYALAYRGLRRKLTRLGSEYNEANQTRYKTTAEAFGGIKEVKIAGREGHFLRRFKPASSAFARTQADRQVYSTIPKYIIEALTMGSLLAILLFFLATGNGVTAIIPVMGVFVYAGYRMLPAFRDLLRAKASFRFTEEIFSSIEGALDQSKGKALAVERDVSEITFEEAIRLDDVSYSYPQAGESAVEDLHIEIPKNATVGLVGKTGAGKTTIVDILLGLLRPTEGALAIDGRRIDGSNAADWQANVGYVPQDIFLADTSIRANIAYGVSDEDIDDDAVERAARIAQIHDFVDDLPDGYDTVVGEDGVRLSGGQRQRIGIARALYRDPPVLVLDEATSDIDGATQESISDAIQNMKGERTLVLVAHRFETIRQCDRIYVISEGEIEASGSFTDLMASNEHFRELAGGTAVQQAEA